MGKLVEHAADLDNDDLQALRDGFGEGMMELGATNKDVVALCADLTESDRLESFKKKWPDRFIEVGISEQHMISAAAGMAHVGKIPFTASFAVFAPGRSWDQLRVSVCYSGNNVKLYGGHAGITVGEDGATHEALEDIAITRVLPRMIVIVPADATEMKKATIAAALHEGPVYLRGGRPKRPQVTTEKSPFEIGKALPLRTGKDVTIIACGIMVREALLAAQDLAKGSIDCAVIDMHTIKPLDQSAVIKAATETGAIVTAEEHQVIGGLGSAVAECLARQLPIPMEFVGVRDMFGESGTSDALQDKYGLRAEDIKRAVRRVLERKGTLRREELKVSKKVLKRIAPKRRAAKKSAKKAKTPIKSVSAKKTTMKKAAKKRAKPARKKR